MEGNFWRGLKINPDSADAIEARETLWEGYNAIRREIKHVTKLQDMEDALKPCEY